MDDMYEEFFGSKPKKRGAGYELLVAYVLQHLNQKSKLTHNKFIKSSYGNSNYQTDALMENRENLFTFIEAKDYQDKVERDVILIITGKILVLNDIDKAICASPNGYTKGAEQYTHELEKANAKPVDLYIVRGIRDEDLKNRINTIVIKMKCIALDWNNVKLDIKWTKEAKEILEKLVVEGAWLDIIFNENGIEIENIASLTKNTKCSFGETISRGKWEFKERPFLQIKNTLIPFEYISYEVPNRESFQEMKIEREHEPKIYVESLSGDVDTLISLEELKEAKKEIESKNCLRGNI